MKALCLLIVALFVSHRLPAQRFSLDWFTIDGGGGTSVGASFALSGSIGQPDAGTLRGGVFVLEGGFWSGVMITENFVVPALNIQLVSGIIMISWDPKTPGFVLQQSDSLSSPAWADAPSGNTNPVSVAINSNATRFYRLIRR
jgi:hypothetical protein